MVVDYQRNRRGGDSRLNKLVRKAGSVVGLELDKKPKPSWRTQSHTLHNELW